MVTQNLFSFFMSKEKKFVFTHFANYLNPGEYMFPLRVSLSQQGVRKQDIQGE
jgi:hypothetical protein